MFWLSYEYFSISSDAFCHKKSFPAKTAAAVHINYMAFVFRLKQKK